MRWTCLLVGLVLAAAAARVHAQAPEPDAGAPAPDSGAQEPSSPEPPPPPKQDGDYAGSGPGQAPAPPAGAPSQAQEDFDDQGGAQEFKKPQEREFSVRIDVLNWLLLGRLGVELEATLWKFISLELTPVFVTASSPIALNYAGLDDALTQHSNGIGPISGVRIGAGVWLGGEPFRGYVARLSFTNYGYEYRSADGSGVFDRVEYTERRLQLFFGSHSRFGPFTFAGGFGLGYELNQVERCGLSTGGRSSGMVAAAKSSGCDGKQLIALDRSLDERADLNGGLHPIYFEARFSLGVVF